MDTVPTFRVNNDKGPSHTTPPPKTIKRMLALELEADGFIG
jgi:hypothetical protein